MNPLTISKQTQAEAVEILTKTNLLEYLQAFGDVRIGGSYYTELMVGPDIDISVATNTPRESSTNFLQKIINLKIFQKHQYGDFETFPRKDRPQDHIVSLILPFKNKTWEIEIWFTKNHYSEQIDIEEKLKKIPEEVKLEILQKKIERDNSNIDKHLLPSYKIYKQILDK